MNIYIYVKENNAKGIHTLIIFVAAKIVSFTTLSAEIWAGIQTGILYYIYDRISYDDNVQVNQIVVIFLAGEVIFANTNRNRRRNTSTNTGRSTDRNIYI